MADGVSRIIQFGLSGVPGATGPQGPAGPAGTSSLGPPAAGVATMNSSVLRVNSYHEARSIGANVASTGAAAIIVQHQLVTESSKIVLAAWCKRASDGKIQTLDGARCSKYTGGAWTLVASGTDIADDTDAVGCVFVVAQTAGVLSITGNIAAGWLLGATIYEAW